MLPIASHSIKIIKYFKSQFSFFCITLVSNLKNHTISSVCIYSPFAMRKSRDINSNQKTWWLVPNRYDYLKVFAIITMIVDHLGYYLFPEMEILRRIGRLAFPIFLFLVGWNRKYQRQWTLFIIAVIVQLSHLPLVRNGSMSFTLNILLVIVLVRGFLLLITPLLRKTPLLTILFSCGVLVALHPWLNHVLDYWSLWFLVALRGWSVASFPRYAWWGWVVLLWLLWQNMVVFQFGGGILTWQGGLLGGFYILLWIFLIYLTSRKPSFSITPFWDHCVIVCSRYALWIYLIHIRIFLGILMLRLGLFSWML